MVDEIKGSTDDAHVQMTLGKFGKVFDPDWLQALNGASEFTVQFNSTNDHDENAVINFAELNGYELREAEEPDSGWKRYYFE